MGTLHKTVDTALWWPIADYGTVVNLNSNLYAGLVDISGHFVETLLSQYKQTHTADRLHQLDPEVVGNFTYPAPCYSRDLQNSALIAGFSSGIAASLLLCGCATKLHNPVLRWSTNKLAPAII